MRVFVVVVVVGIKSRAEVERNPAKLRCCCGRMEEDDDDAFSFWVCFLFPFSRPHGQVSFLFSPSNPPSIQYERMPWLEASGSIGMQRNFMNLVALLPSIPLVQHTKSACSSIHAQQAHGHPSRPTKPTFLHQNSFNFLLTHSNSCSSSSSSLLLFSFGESTTENGPALPLPPPLLLFYCCCYCYYL